VIDARDALRRALEFELGIEDRCATETTPFEWGMLLCYPALPRVWALNFARAEETPASLDAAELAGAVLKLPWPSVVLHRKIVVNDDATGRRLAPGFRAMDWEVERLLFMVLRSDAVPDFDRAVAQEVSSDDQAAAMVAYLPLIDTKYEPDVLHQIIDSRKVVEGAIDVRHFGAFVDGELASTCELFTGGSTAQIENVTTAERFRGRGLSKTVVGTAIAEARASGADFVFLIADADDWPKEMYRKMGFEDIGITYEFHLPESRGAL
jgi:ribosomal protein S18 acetylase RimI-like enzyme